MKSLGEMSVGEVAAYVAEHLRQSDINVVLTGGSCVSIYTDNRYLSYDLDFIEEGRSKAAVWPPCHGVATCFSIFFTCSSQPLQCMRNASWRRSAGIPSKPDSTRRSRVPSSTACIVNTTSVIGSCP